MNLQMDPLDNPLATRPIQTGSKISIEPYLNGHFGSIDNLDREFGARSIPTRTQTRSDGPELLATLFSTDEDTCHIITNRFMWLLMCSISCNQLLTGLVSILLLVHTYIGWRIERFKILIQCLLGGQQCRLTPICHL